jgi:hypothetical protein
MGSIHTKKPGEEPIVYIDPKPMGVIIHAQNK